MSNLAADNAIASFLARTDALIRGMDPQGRRVARELTAVLEAADGSLSKRLLAFSHLTGDELLFSEASMLMYQSQIRSVLEVVQGRLLGFTNEQSIRAASLGLRRVVDLTNKLETAFTGIAMPLRVDESIISRMRPSLLARHETSVARYGSSMIRRAQMMMSQGFIEGISQGQMVDRLMRLKGPRGLFVESRYWAWRIIRTETAEAQNMASQMEIEQAAQAIPDMQRKILAIMDKRTARDSIGVHGQVRGRNEPFTDGAGRVYQRPPSRPHDRETLIPWRSRWPHTSRSRPLTREEQDSVWDQNQRWQADQQRQRRRQRARGV